MIDKLIIKAAKRIVSKVYGGAIEMLMNRYNVSRNHVVSVLNDYSSETGHQFRFVIK